MKFSAQWVSAEPGPELTDLAKEMQDLGYWAVAFPDHFSTHAGRGIIEPNIALTWVAAVTDTLRLNQLVCNNDLRHPALFSWQMSYLDLLSGGRVEAAIGAGWNKPEYDALGINFDRPSVRIARMAEAIQIMRQFWDNDSVSFHGEFYDIEGLAGAPGPVQKHLPLMVGGNGTKTLTVAGTHADIVAMGFGADVTDEHVTERIAVARNAATSAGRNPDDLTFQVMFSCGFDGDDAGTSWPLSGDAGKMIDEIKRREELGIGYMSMNGVDREKIRRFGRDVISKF